MSTLDNQSPEAQFEPIYISLVSPLSFHPHDCASEVITNYVNQIFDTLTITNNDGTLHPGLASEWGFIDETTFAITLKKGIKFHNDEIMDADAVKFTFDLFLNPTEKVDNRS